MSSQADGPLVDEVTIRVDALALSWPEPGAAGYDAGLGGNRHYSDMRGTGWRSVAAVLQEEAKYLARLRRAQDITCEVHEVLNELEQRNEDEGGHPLWGLDIGVAGATLALAASGCITFTSCNGGAFGDGRHLEGYPLVGFFMRPRLVGLISEAADTSGTGLLMHGDGSLQVYAGDAWRLHVFAQTLFKHRGEIRQANRVGRPQAALNVSHGRQEQLELFR